MNPPLAAQKLLLVHPFPWDIGWLLIAHKRFGIHCLLSCPCCAVSPVWACLQFGTSVCWLTGSLLGSVWIGCFAVWQHRNLNIANCVPSLVTCVVCWDSCSSSAPTHAMRGAFWLLCWVFFQSATVYMVLLNLYGLTSHSSLQQLSMPIQISLLFCAHMSTHQLLSL